MELHVWPSGFLLPSIDCHCLQALAASRFHASVQRVVRSKQPWATPNGAYPVCKFPDSSTLTDVEKIFNYLRRQEMPLDGDDLTAVQKAEIMAYDSMLKSKLYPAYLYMLWVDSANFNVFTTHYYGRLLPIGYSVYYVSKMRHWAKDYLRSLFPGELVTDENIEFLVKKQALICINSLSAKLGEQKYFFGNKPSSLDALVFGYLAPLLKLPLPNDQLQLHIRACSNLAKMIDLVIKIYLPLSDEDITVQTQELSEYEKRKENAQKEMRAKQSAKNASDDEFPTHDRIRNYAMFGVGAIVLSLLVAVHTGLIQVEVQNVQPD